MINVRKFNENYEKRINTNIYRKRFYAFKLPKSELRNYNFMHFYAPQLYRQVLLKRVLAMGILSVRPSVTTRGYTSPGEIETPGLHHEIA